MYISSQQFFFVFINLEQTLQKTNIEKLTSTIKHLNNIKYMVFRVYIWKRAHEFEREKGRYMEDVEED